MNEEQITTFLTIANCGTFSRAAALLSLTQPTVSHRIRSLEEELDTALFTRGTAAAALTPAGRAFLPEAERLMRSFAGARRALRPYGTRRQLVIAFPALMIEGRFTAYRAVMSLGSPGVRLKARILHMPEEGPEALRSGDADMVFADPSLSCFAGDEFRRKELFTSGVYICVHRGHRLADLTAVTREDLAGETVYTYRDSTFFTETLISALTPANLTIRSGKAGFEETARRLRPDGGLMFANTRLLDLDWLRYVPLALPLPMRVGLVWTKKGQDGTLLAIIDRIAALPRTVWRT